MKDNNKTDLEQEDFEEFVAVGKNAVSEILEGDLQVEKILVQRDNDDHLLKVITDKARDKGIIVQSVRTEKLDTASQNGNHQGIVALLSPYPYCSLDEIIEKNKDKENQILVLLDHITDPRNLGAIIRDAEVCGALAVLFPARRSAGLSPAAVKASSGAVAYIDIAKVGNLNQTVETLKKNGYWVAGADMDGKPYYKTDLKGKMVVVLGNEGAGLSKQLKKNCDFLVGIPDYGKIDSMNVSAAAAVILAEAAKQQHEE